MDATLFTHSAIFEDVKCGCQFRRLLFGAKDVDLPL